MRLTRRDCLQIGLASAAVLACGRSIPAFLTRSVRASDGELPLAANLATIEQRARAAYAKLTPSIVRISYGKSPELVREAGSGVIVSETGYVLVSSGVTRSVVHDEFLTIHLASGRRVRGRALGWDGERAIGLLQISEPGPWPFVNLDNKAPIAVGQLCLAMGYTDLQYVEFDRQPALHLGAVTSLSSPMWLTVSCVLRAGGNSVFDLDGRLLGVTVRQSLGRDPILTSAAMINDHWKGMIDGKNLDRERMLSPETGNGTTAADRPEPRFAESDERVAAAIEKAKSASVRIVELSASGVIVSADGYIISCAHHLGNPGQKVTVSLSDGRDAHAVVLGMNKGADICLIKITDEGSWPYAPRGRSATLEVGARCILVGYPVAKSGREPWVQQNTIIKPTQTLPTRDDQSDKLWTAGFEVSPDSPGGRSGGGVFDLEGRVVGIILGGAGDEMFHNRIELFRSQWDVLAAANRIETIKGDPLAEISAAFLPLASKLAPCVVEVFADGMAKALGIIVGRDGQILTKASELNGALACRLSDGREFPATVRRVFQDHDLVLLKIDAAGLSTVPWSQDGEITPGSPIAAIIPGQPARAGVVALAARPSPQVAGGLGVSLTNSDRGLTAGDILDERYNVPLLNGDIVVRINNQPTPDLAAYEALFLKGKTIAHAGEPVNVRVQRGSESLNLQFTWPPYNLVTPTDHQTKTASLRWWGFPRVFDTDIRLKRTECGGPVIDRSGRVVGIYIASGSTVHGGVFAFHHVIPAQVANGLISDD